MLTDITPVIQSPATSSVVQVLSVAYSPLGHLGHAPPPFGPAAEKSATQQLKTVKASNALKRTLGSTNEALITLLLILIIVGFCFSVSNR